MFFHSQTWGEAIWLWLKKTQHGTLSTWKHGPDSSKHHIGATGTLIARRCILYAAKGLVPKWEDCPAPLGSSPQQLMGVELMPLPQRGRNPPTSPDALLASWVRKESSEDQLDQFAFD